MAVNAVILRYFAPRAPVAKLQQVLAFAESIRSISAQQAGQLSLRIERHPLAAVLQAWLELSGA